MLAQQVIAAKRDGKALARPMIDAFVQGLVDGSWSDAQAAALAMAVLLRGMDTDETVALTDAMTRSGEVLAWPEATGPVLDKHSTGGVGDKVSLVLAPLVAACGGWVPMVSGRGLGHTGGTLDKLESLPGYRSSADRATLLAALRDAGCAIVGASGSLAPADRRLYAIRDVTATVESVPLITASILSKKIAAGLSGLVLDVKVGNGAFLVQENEALRLAQSLVRVARGAGLPAVARLTDMNQVLGLTAGNALEVREAIAMLLGEPGVDVRFAEVTLDLAARLLVLGGLAADVDAARNRARSAIASGEAAARFARMVAALGGPRDVLRAAQLPRAPVQRVVPAPHGGVVTGIDVRALGFLVVGLGGGRRRGGERIDPRVGFDRVVGLGARVERGDPLLVVHAGTEAAADQALAATQSVFTIGDAPLAETPPLLGALVE